MIIVYTGKGEGKTCAAMGQAMRAIGQGQSLVVAQFFKSMNSAGEQLYLERTIPGLFLAGGLGTYYTEENRPAQREKAYATYIWLTQHPAQCVIMDEINQALHYGLLTQAEINVLLQRNVLTTWVFTGMGAPEWLIEKANLVTEFTPLKPYGDLK